MSASEEQQRWVESAEAIVSLYFTDGNRNSTPISEADIEFIAHQTSCPFLYGEAGYPEHVVKQLVFLLENPE